MRSVFEAVDLGDLGATMNQAEMSVQTLLQEEDRVEEIMSEISALTESVDRLESSGLLFNECDVFIRRCKALGETIKNAKKRVKEARDKVSDRLKKELDGYADGKARSQSFSFSIGENPVSVIITDESEIPKKYRVDPGPKPPPEKWPPNKAAIKTALSKQHVQKIPGAKLERGTRVEVKSR